MPEVNGFRCWIEDAATTECFPEYMTFKEDAHTVTTFITSQPRKQFRINCSRTLPTPRVTFKILIGDKEIKYPAKTTNHLYHYQSVVGQKRTHTSYAPFVFNVNCVSLRLFEDKEMLSKEMQGNRIVLKLWRRCNDVSSAIVIPVKPYLNGKGQVIGRRGMDAGLGDCVGYGKVVKTAPTVQTKVVQHDLIDGYDNPHAVFIFEFRTHDYLKKQGIIPADTPLYSRESSLTFIPDVGPSQHKRKSPEEDEFGFEQLLERIEKLETEVNELKRRCIAFGGKIGKSYR